MFSYYNFLLMESTGTQGQGQVAKNNPPKGGLNLIEILKDYIENMLLEC